ncbi:hypothetical protein GCM10010978_19820 [Compostibacillus humi]|uniref:Uncharacterized protein n=1 Tax=Compostibacillus humi TaxID=1245525 RepID=A0A8J2TL22_9BACI|nr:hypothetical protein [Compostibacillus humi]GFZ78297.1 hypothetical protein GCM10010978_19820 [Compostibacillus humi]
MKRYLSGIFIFLSVIFVIIGFVLDFYWSGIVGWGLAVICLILALYFTKYITDEKKDR